MIADPDDDPEPKPSSSHLELSLAKTITETAHGFDSVAGRSSFSRSRRTCVSTVRVSMMLS